MDASSKVWYLNDGLCNDFDKSKTLYQDNICQKKALTIPKVQVALVQARGSKRGCDDVKDRYYTKEEYKALTLAQKNALRAKRRKRGDNTNGGKKTNKILNVLCLCMGMKVLGDLVIPQKLCLELWLMITQLMGLL